MKDSSGLKIAAVAACVVAGLAACGGDDDDVQALPQLAAATGASLTSCTDLATRITFANTTFTAANAIAAGTLTVAGTPVPAHCQVTGRMFQRVSTVDGNSYAIGFEMRLPNAWNGRFFYQANGGIDGTVVTATGGVNGGPALTNALAMGFAVISSDAGHAGALGPFFGVDPQARLDYGYQAVAKLTPMAKAAIQTAYGKGPDRSYFGGCSNGGRHTMVAAARYRRPVRRLPRRRPGLPPAAGRGRQHRRRSRATPRSRPTRPIRRPASPRPSRQLVADAVLAKCDALDGAADGLIQDTGACKAAFDLNRDVPTCTGARDGTCLTAAQKTVDRQALRRRHHEHRNGLLRELAVRRRHRPRQHRVLELHRAAGARLGRDPHSSGRFRRRRSRASTAPAFALTSSIDTLLAKIQATNATYTENSLSVHDAAQRERPVDAEEPRRAR